MKNIKYKVCSTCGEEKELNAENFGKAKANKDGYNGRCKECVKAYKKQYYQENKEEISKKEKQRNKENRESIAEYQKQWRKENKEKIAEYHKQYYQENTDLIVKYQKQWREDNKEKMVEYHKQYYQENKEYYSEYYKQYRQSEQGRISKAKSNQIRRARINSLPNTLTTEQYNENLDHFDYKCAYCERELTPDNHHMEHVYPISRGIYGTTKENCIPSCESCNSSKHAKTLAEWYVWTEDYSFERLLKIHEITSGGKEWIVSNK